MGFTKAVKSQAKLKMAITGTSGSGKTYTALRVARGIGDRVALIDSEHKSASKYADLFEFDALDISANTHPNEYVKAIEMARADGYDVLIIDSLTHAWDATKKEVDRLSQASRSGNSYVQWAQGTKIWDGLKAAINKAPMHIIVTMRSKTDYVQEDNNGKKQVRKVGLAPEVRDGTEYEYDIVLDMTTEHFGSISKTRCASLDGYAQEKPGEDLGESLKAWLSDGVEALPEPEQPPKEKPILTEEQKLNAFLTACSVEEKRIGFDKWALFVEEWNIADLQSLEASKRQEFYKQLKEIK